jgi:flavin-dependent dehydrogenase
MYDAIVIGARCAGASTAMLLARRGYRVLLVDKTAFPSDIPHGHFIHRHGPARMRKWGVLDRLTEAGSPAITTFHTDFDDFPITGRNLVFEGVAAAYAPRRVLLDKLLVDAAVDAGAELREGFIVEDLLFDGDRVIGMRGRSGDGRTITDYASITIGADGRNSRVARAVHAPLTEAAPTVCCWYFSYWTDVSAEGLYAYARRDHAIFAFPTDHGLFGVFIGWSIDRLPVVRANLEREFMNAVLAENSFGERVVAGRRAERYYGATDMPNFLRKPYGPGWALVGDAGCHKDPFLALGICDAFRDAELLADTCHRGLSGPGLDRVMPEYERLRNEATLPDYHWNLDSARFMPSPADLQQLRRAVQGDEEATHRYFAAIEGHLPFDAVQPLVRA